MHRLKSIDALRAIAALLVLSFHYEALLTFRFPAEWPDSRLLYSHYGLMGVELFFIISGFVILMTIDRNDNISRFVVGRIARMYPAYFASVVVSGAFLFAISAVTIPVIVVNFTMLQKFVGVADLVTPYWTLAYEIWFYAVMAAISLAGHLKSIDRLALVWLAIAFALRLKGIHLGGIAFLLFMQQFGHLFIAGMMIYRITRYGVTVATLASLAMCVAYSGFGRQDWANVPAPAYFTMNGLFIAAVWLAVSWKRLRAPAWLVSIGVASYSLYLFHLPVGLILAYVGDSLGVSRWLAITLSVPASVCAASASRELIEVPGQRFIMQLLGRRSLEDERRRIEP